MTEAKRPLTICGATPYKKWGGDHGGAAHEGNQCTPVFGNTLRLSVTNLLTENENLRRS